MKTLLHVCCGPCALYPVQVLREKGPVHCLFFNPNIHPLTEYRRRLDCARSFCEENDIPFSVLDYAPEEYFRAVAGSENDAAARCSRCWEMRLAATARFARENGCQRFTTTLLVSPYQDIDRIGAIGTAIARAEGVAFYFADLRPGFRRAHAEARARGMYLQNYCGCLFSEIERDNERAKRKRKEK